MNARRLLLVTVGACILTAGCAAAADAVVSSPAPPLAGSAPAASPAACQRDHVYVFLVNGLDPFFFCQFNKLPDYVRSLGYSHVSMGQMSSESQFVNDIRRARATDPNARVLLLGFSTGANTVCHMCHTLKDQGCPVDVLVYLGGCYIYNRDYSRPQNVKHIINLRDSGLVTFSGGLLRGEDVDGTENLKIPGLTLHIMTPDNPLTRDTMASALAQMAASVPLPDAPVPPPALKP